MDPVNDVLNHLNGQITANQLVATLAIVVAARNDNVAKKLADSIDSLSKQLDSDNHEEFNRGFSESIERMRDLIANSEIEGGQINMDIGNFKT